MPTPTRSRLSKLTVSGGSDSACVQESTLTRVSTRACSPLLVDDTYNYLKFLSDAAHNKGLGIGLKNSPGMIRDRPEVVKFNDFLIIEECAKYNECAAYQPFVDAKKATWQVEYETKTPCTMPGFTVLSYSRCVLMSFMRRERYADSCLTMS